MELKLAPEQFEQHQEIFIEKLVEIISIKLREGGLKDRQLEELTANIAFSLASAIDDTSGLESDGIEVKPYLTFRTGEEEIIHCGENAYTYEFVIGILKKLFSGQA